MSEELKENMCLLEFECMSESQYCAYGNSDGTPCKHEGPSGYCNSSVARVNAMIIELKRLGFVATDETQKSLLKEIRGLLQKSLDSGFGLRPVELAVGLIDSVLS